jgi:hypothetical protein
VFQGGEIASCRQKSIYTQYLAERMVDDFKGGEKWAIFEEAWFGLLILQA